MLPSKLHACLAPARKEHYGLANSQCLCAVQPHNVLLRPRDERPGGEGEGRGDADGEGQTEAGLLSAGAPFYSNGALELRTIHFAT